MPTFSPVLFALVTGYLCGSIPSAVIIAKIMHLPDPRTLGSKNPGATNMMRLGGKKVGAMTFLFDALKAFVPVLVAKQYYPEAVVLSVMLGAFLGHIYSLFLKFKGGKGVATGLGAWLGLSLPLGIAAMSTWLFMAIVFRYSSLAALTSAILAPFFCAYFLNVQAAVIVGSMSLLLILKHQENISKLVNGTESKIGKKVHT